jgi:putative nucleotidyltransferase with HDIG domain
MATSLLRKLGFLRTRFGRRTLASFLGAALLPAVVAAGFSITRLRSTMAEEAAEALSADAKAAAVSVLDRLALLTDRADGARSAAGEVVRELRLSPDVGSDDVTLVLEPGTATSRTVQFDLGALWASLGERFDGSDQGFCVFASEPRRRLHCSTGVPLSVLRQLDERDQVDGEVVAVDGYLTARRDVFLRHEYGAPAWSIVLVRSSEPADATLRSEMLAALFVGLVALVTAFVLSHMQIRRNTAPIETLQRASRALRDGQLETRVALTSNDEFSELGSTFNAMAHSLHRQLRMFSSFEALDETALRAPGSDVLVTSALTQLGSHMSAVVTSVVLLDEDGDGLQYFTADPTDAHALARARGALSAPCRTMLLSTASHVTTPDFLRHTSLVDPSSTLWHSGLVAHVLVVPLRHDTELLGAVLLGVGHDAGHDRDAVQAERRMAERLSLGLANARLLARLEALSLGTLRAFGSAIDANSRWTAGHSDRVTAYAVLLAESMGLSDAERDTLRRGCLLHDIGKVGIPASILDKPSALTDAEFAIVRQHPEIGARILAPIPAFRDLLPIVRSHHERVDGRGYPDGLQGDAIPLLARVAAVADVFDALTSARPYRAGLPIHDAIANITAGRGTHFEPRIVDVLVSLADDARLVRIVHPDARPALDTTPGAAPATRSHTDGAHHDLIFDTLTEPMHLSPVTTR